MKIKYIYYLVLLAFISSCQPVVDDFTPSAGGADFSSYVVVGNSLSAGFADGALYSSGQEYSFSNIIAEQLQFVGNNGTFKIPMMPTENGVRPNLTPQGIYFTTKLIVGYSTDCLGNTSLAPVPAVKDPNQQELQAQLFTSVADQGPFNNVAVPNIKITHIFMPGYGLLNPYYGRFATNPQTDKIIDEPAKVNPTFFQFWLGNNDILGYATSGGLEPVTPVGGTVGVGFEASYNAAIETMISLTGKGVVANIPNITSIPFFTTVPYNAVVLTQQAQVDALNTAYAPYNTLMEQYGFPYRINFALGQNAMIIYDAAIPFPPEYEQFKFRQIAQDELVLLTVPQDSLKCAGWGTQKPVPDQYVLTTTELNVIQSTTSAYNSIIKNAVNKYNLAFFDANSKLKVVSSNGVVEDGVSFTSTLITGNSFSTDGIHLSPQGNALVANYFIEAINSKYAANIPLVNMTDYPPIQLP